MIIDERHRPWIAATLAILAASSAFYAYTVWASPSGPSGGSVPGLLFGIAGSALMVFAGLLSARKRPGVRIRRLGSASAWLRGHIWLGLLSLPLIAFHAGFHWGGPLEIALWVVFLTIIASGIVGVILQTIIPRLMTEQVPLETIYYQIPHLCQVVQEEADATVVAACGKLGLPGEEEKAPEKKPKKGEAAFVENDEHRLLKTFYKRDVRDFLGSPYQRQSSLTNSLHAKGKFDEMKKRVSPSLHPAIDALSGFCEERRQLARQVTLHHWLHRWLLVHVPLSFALLALAIAHIVSALYY